MKNNRPLIIFLGGFLFFCIDQIIKQLALKVFLSDRLFLGVLGWSPFHNPGVAFSLPLPNTITITVTIFILFTIIYILIKHLEFKNKTQIFIGLTLIFWGALSNLIDRLLYKNTIDYFLVGTGVINLADIMIAAGFIAYLLPHKFFKT